MRLLTVRVALIALAALPITTALRVSPTEQRVILPRFAAARASSGSDDIVDVHGNVLDENTPIVLVKTKKHADPLQQEAAIGFSVDLANQTLRTEDIDDLEAAKSVGDVNNTPVGEVKDVTGKDLDEEESIVIVPIPPDPVDPNAPGAADGYVSNEDNSSGLTGEPLARSTADQPLDPEGCPKFLRDLLVSCERLGDTTAESCKDAKRRCSTDTPVYIVCADGKPKESCPACVDPRRSKTWKNCPVNGVCKLIGNSDCQPVSEGAAEAASPSPSSRRPEKLRRSNAKENLADSASPGGPPTGSQPPPRKMRRRRANQKLAPLPQMEPAMKPGAAERASRGGTKTSGSEHTPRKMRRRSKP